MGDTIGMDDCDLISKSAISSISSCSPIPSPDLSCCHRCGLRFPVSDTIDRFRTLDSHWRIVLLCYDCLDGVKSAKVCSYCFMGIPDLGNGLLRCIACSCRVHRTCIPLHHRNLWSLKLDTGVFICVDCCPVHIFRGVDLDKSRSRTGFRFSLEDLVREVKSISKEVATEGKARKNTVNRALAARSSTEVTKIALGAVHLVTKPHIHYNTVPDEELALRLHRSINGSQRISRTFYLKDETRLNALSKVRWSNCSTCRVADSSSFRHHVKTGGCSENKSLLHAKIEVCSENRSLLKDGETSESILTSNLLDTESENLSKQIRGDNTEGIDGFSLKEKDILYMSPETTSDCSNVVSSSLPMNDLLNNSMPLTKFRFGVGEGSSELQRKAIDAPGSDMCTEKYFRRRWGSRRFLLGS